MYVCMHICMVNVNANVTVGVNDVRDGEYIRPISFAQFGLEI
jgi:hypothetical protein